MTSPTLIGKKPVRPRLRFRNGGQCLKPPNLDREKICWKLLTRKYKAAFWCDEHLRRYFCQPRPQKLPSISRSSSCTRTERTSPAVMVVAKVTKASRDSCSDWRRVCTGISTAHVEQCFCARWATSAPDCVPPVPPMFTSALALGSYCPPIAPRRTRLNSPIVQGNR